MKKRTQYYPILLLSLILLCNACSKSQRAQEKKNEHTIINVTTAMPRQESVQIEETFTANVEPEVRNIITPQMPGRIDKILVQVGDHVQRGQLLAVMDESNLKQMEAKLKNTERDYQRVDELYKIGGVSKAQWQAQKMAMEISQTSVKSLRENTYLRSPISGVISLRSFEPGDMYAPGRPLLVVEQINPLKVKININEGYLSKIKKGMPADLSFDSYPDRHFTGKVSLIYPTIDPMSRTFTTEITLNNKDQEIRPGMYAQVHLIFGTQKVLTIPDKAVLTLSGTGEKYLFIYKNGQAIRRTIQVGKLIQDRYAVDGVEMADAVITSGLTNIHNGDSVKVVSQ